ncbi:MAG: hypothetical protein ACE5EK_02480 [Nitrospinales bacterium]
MDQIEHPSQTIWKKRQDWFEDLFDVDKRGGGYLIGEQATGLLIDLQAIFCAGAFISCVILACTIIDSHLRETEAGSDFDGGIKATFQLSAFNDDLDWLRKRRNQLIHFKEKRDLPICVDDHYFRRVEHEQDAKRAIVIVSNVLFENPWV